MHVLPAAPTCMSVHACTPSCPDLHYKHDIGRPDLHVCMTLAAPTSSHRLPTQTAPGMHSTEHMRPGLVLTHMVLTHMVLTHMRPGLVLALTLTSFIQRRPSQPCIGVRFKVRGRS